MIFRFLRGALRLHPFRLGLIIISTAMGASIVASFGDISLHIKDQLATELRSFGPNIVVEPEEPAQPAGALPVVGYLNEADVQKALTVFWRNNIIGISPTLTGPVNISGGAGAEQALLVGLWFEKSMQRPGMKEYISAGMLPLFPYWQLDGTWKGTERNPGLILGNALAARLGLNIGDSVTLVSGEKTLDMKISGILSAGGFEEDEIFVNLDTAQEFLDLKGKISNILISVITVPLDAFGRKDPGTMNKLEFEKWYCTAYITSVATQFEDDIKNSRARPLWSMAEAEARVLSRLNILMALLAAVALAASMLAVASSFTARIMGRKSELALMRACGAGAWQVVLVLGAEIAMLGLMGGLVGAVLSVLIIKGLGVVVFSIAIKPTIFVLPISMLSSLLVAAVGAAFPIWQAISADPVDGLKEAG